jgi:large subunit ribosomal protein L17
MRHRLATRSFNRDTKERQALLKGLVRSVVEHGSITTTLAKAKETRRLVDKLIYKAKTDSVATRRVLHQFFGRRDSVNKLVDVIAPLFTTRNSGFTRIVSVGKRRGDNTSVATLSLVNLPEKSGLKKAEAVKEVKTTAKTKSTKKSTKRGEIESLETTKVLARSQAPKIGKQTVAQKTVQRVQNKTTSSGK